MSEPIQTTAFRQIVDTEVAEFVNASREFHEPLAAMGNMVRRAFEHEFHFIRGGVLNLRPDNASLDLLKEPLSTTLREIQEFRDRNRHVEQYFNHLATVAESVLALSWISVKTTPVQFVRDMREAGDYFGNRVLSTNKGNQQHMAWINKWQAVLRALEQYVKDYHLTGFAWGAGRVGNAPALPGLPPPPPPPPITYSDALAGGDDRHALLNEINQGVGIVRMLRPVRRDEAPQVQPQAEDAPAVVPAAPVAPAAPVPPAAPAAPLAPQPIAQRAYPPKFLLEGRKWRIEHQRNSMGLELPNNDMSESLAMFKCENVGLQVKNKMNGVTIDNCKRSTIVLQDIISSVELIRCDRVRVQCNGHVPLISLDNCDSVQVFLTDRSLDAELISSKSTSLNVCLLQPDGDYVELAVPEQIKTVVVGRRLQSSVVEKI